MKYCIVIYLDVSLTTVVKKKNVYRSIILHQIYIY